MHKEEAVDAESPSMASFFRQNAVTIVYALVFEHLFHLLTKSSLVQNRRNHAAFGPCRGAYQRSYPQKLCAEWLN